MTLQEWLLHAQPPASLVIEAVLGGGMICRVEDYLGTQAVFRADDLAGMLAVLAEAEVEEGNLRPAVLDGA